MLDALRVILSFNQEVYEIIGLSLLVSLTSTFIASIVGSPFAIYLSLTDFKFKKFILQIIYMFMAVPPVVMGLFVFLTLSRRGPLGSLELLFSPTAMIIAQTLLVLPIVIGNITNSTENINKLLKETCITLGGSKKDLFRLVFTETRPYIVMAIVLAFSRAISEVGAVMLVGGNIKSETRVMTTYISLNNSMGEHEIAIAMAIVLLFIAFIVNTILMHYRKVISWV